tara:strand:+ start:3911 stop:4411 length:501 start_codon:yes stop_codon:yes gene_type:complete
MAKNASYSLSGDIVEKILDPVFSKGLKNKEAIKALIMNSLNTNEMELLIDMFFSKTKHKPLFKGCYVLVTPKSYWEGDKYEVDKLKDRGLYSNDGRIYGRITADSSWDPENFNPYYYEFKVNLILLDKKDQVTEVAEEMKATALELLPDGINDIKWFSVHAKNKLV